MKIKITKQKHSVAQEFFSRQINSSKKVEKRKGLNLETKINERRSK